jgi:predicted nucleic acid-binding protein
MAAKPRRIYWDSCAWIALIQDEVIRDPATGQITENRGQICRAVIDAAKAGTLEIVTSTFALVEVCKCPGNGSSPALDLAGFFENPWILRITVDTEVAAVGRHLMLAGHAGLKPPDAVHLASALVTERVEEAQTFDGALLKLNGQIFGPSGDLMPIYKPRIPSNKPAPLLDEIARATPNPRA